MSLVFRFDRIDVNDEGEYTCTVTNLAGSTSASAVLKVRSPPEITITPSNFQQVLHGEQVTVECRANGYPDPIVSIKSKPLYFYTLFAALFIKIKSTRHVYVYIVCKRGKHKNYLTDFYGLH